MPTVSIIVPTFNRPELLKRALESVRAQTYEDYEVIIVDDGDTVRVKNIVDEFHDPRMRYIAHETPRRGGSASRNTGIRAARALFVAFLDDDDAWLPEKLEIQMAQFANTSKNVGFCIAGAHTESEHLKAENLPKEEGIIDFSETVLRRFAGFLTTTLIVKRSVFDVAGMFDETMPSHQETELMIRITRRYKGLAIKKPLVVMNMFQHEHIGGDMERRIKGRELLLLKHHELYDQRPKVLAFHYFQLGLWCRDSGDMLKAKKYFFKAFHLSNNPRYLAHCALSFLR